MLGRAQECTIVQHQVALSKTGTLCVQLHCHDLTNTCMRCSWAIDMGDKYPSAEILGNDISPIQPTLVPPNVKFEVDDLEEEWVYSTKFDYIHVRYLACSIRDWPKLMQQCFR